MRHRPNWWDRRSWVSTLYVPLSACFLCIAWLRKLYTTPYHASVPVLCVGNMTVGGAGKTPVVLLLAKYYQEQGKRVIIVSRGYGGTLPGPVCVNLQIHTAATVGDEPLLLAREAPTIIAKCRVAGIRYAEGLHADIIIMDDGLQNPSLSPSVRILVIDGVNPCGNGRIFPAGPLREKIETAVKGADKIIWIGNRQHRLYLEIERIKPVIAARIEAKTNNASFNAHRYIAFAGIGNPEKFFQTLRANHIPLAGTYAFPDHHSYTDQEIQKLAKEAEEKKARLITTEKDAVRITKQGLPLDVLPIRITWEQEVDIATWLK